MRALTLYQPWAHAVAHLGKIVENRRQAPPRCLWGNRFAIHAARKQAFDWEGYEYLRELQRRGEIVNTGSSSNLLPDGMAYGSLVAVATCVGYVSPAGRPYYFEAGPAPVRVVQPADLRRWWAKGAVGWLLAEVVPIAAVACRGKQGVWHVPEEIEEALA